jgi:hypothetical protein
MIAVAVRNLTVLIFLSATNYYTPRFEHQIQLGRGNISGYFFN